MDNPVVVEELEALQSIFCAGDEFQCQSVSAKEVIILIQSRVDQYLVSLTVVLNSSYPDQAPHLVLQVNSI